MSRRERLETIARILITAFVAIVLTIVALGWAWTASHQPRPLQIASHIVLAIAALSAVFALARIWRRDPPRVGAGRP